MSRGLDRQAWSELLGRKELELGFSDGYKFVYGPWDTLAGAEVAFLSLNPGKAPDNADMRTLSDERGNSYEVEQHTTKSPMTDQFLRLASLLGRQPADVLTGVAVPFRSGSWGELSKSQQSSSLELGRRFWHDPLTQPELRLIVASSNEAAKLVVDITGASLDQKISSGWGKIMLRRYRCPDGISVLHLPQLSRFKLLSRESCKSALHTALRGVW